MIRGIHHIAINTANFDRMLAFYTEVLGFERAAPESGWRDAPAVDQIIGLDGSSSKVQLLKAGNCYLELFAYSKPPARGDNPLRPCDHGYTHFALDVTDIDAEHKRLVAAGMEFVHHEPGVFGPIKGLYGRDPDGNIIEIQELSPELLITLDELKFNGD